MPLYDYRCENGHRYEEREPFGSPSTHPCRRCKSPAHRVLSVPAITFKGSGWYKTDSRGTNTARNASGSADGNDDTGNSSPPDKDTASDSASGSQTKDASKDKSARTGKKSNRSNKTPSRSGESTEGN